MIAFTVPIISGLLSAWKLQHTIIQDSMPTIVSSDHSFMLFVDPKTGIPKLMAHEFRTAWPVLDQKALSEALESLFSIRTAKRINEAAQTQMRANASIP